MSKPYIPTRIYVCPICKKLGGTLVKVGKGYAHVSCINNRLRFGGSRARQTDMPVPKA